MVWEKIRSCFSGDCPCMNDPSFQAGFCVGAGLIVLVLLIVWRIRAKNKKCDAIQVQENGGGFFLSTTALKTFLKRIVAEFPKADLKDVCIRKKQEGIFLKLMLQVYPDTDVVSLRTRLRERILKAAEDKLGVADQILGIDIKIAKMIDKGEVPPAFFEEPAEEQGESAKVAPKDQGVLPPFL